HSAGLMLASLMRLVAVGGVLLAVSQLIANWRSARASADKKSSRGPVILLVVSVVVALVAGLRLSDIGPFIPMPILLLLLCVAAAIAFWDAARAQNREAQVAAASVTLVSACALLCLARIILRVSTGGALSSFLLPLSVIVFVYIWLELFPI